MYADDTQGMSIRLVTIYATRLRSPLPKPKRELLKRSFKFIGAVLSNQLANEVKLAESGVPNEHFSQN